MSKQIEMHCDNVGACGHDTNDVGGHQLKKMHIDSERSSLSTEKNKWTKCELFLKSDQIRETKIQNILLREMYWNQ